MILGKFEAGQDLEQWSNRQFKFRCKSIIKEYENEVKTDKDWQRLTISKFCSFIPYVLGLFALNTKIEGITKIWFISHFDDVTANFLFFTKNVKIMASIEYKYPQT
jgi:hypothetical protein